MSEVTAVIVTKEGKRFLQIQSEIPANLTGSKSGKSLIVATTNGGPTFKDVIVDGMPVSINLNAYCKLKAA